jgi:hypothetical protein
MADRFLVRIVVSGQCAGRSRRCRVLSGHVAIVQTLKRKNDIDVNLNAIDVILRDKCG